MGKRCYIDNAKGDSECVLDAGATDDCDEAHELSALGLCKDDCPYWRHHQAGASEGKSATKVQSVCVLIRGDAKAAREERTLSEFKTAMASANAAPEFVGNFGHGHFKRPS